MVFEAGSPKFCTEQSSKVVMAASADHYLHIGEYKVFAWSISGIETTVVVQRKTDGFSCCFDMGATFRENVKMDKVMITHGHMDHISAIPQHIRRREVLGFRRATYFVPVHLVRPLLETCIQFSKISEDSLDLELPSICGVSPGTKIELNKCNYAIPFPTMHRVQSQGYLVYKMQKDLKPECKGLTGAEIGAKIKAGDEVYVVEHIPDIAYTGDTTFEVFTNVVHPDLFKVKLLIVEATYMNDTPYRLHQARQSGHIHLAEIYENAALFKDVKHILLIHHSDKYPVQYIRRKVTENVPAELKDKIFVSTLAKERYI